MKSDDALERILCRVQKPGRYIGGEVGAVIKDKSGVDLRFAFCFPDVYEVAMSHLGMRIIYGILNRRPGIWCERAFAPWFDMGAQLKQNEYPLYALESRDSLSEFDVLGFTLQYEMSYTNVLYMLDLAGIPFFAKDRDETFPLVVGGGPCACNPEPMADFFDLFVIGDGEEVTVELCDFLARTKQDGFSKSKTLRLAAKIKGIYVPSLYKVSHGRDGKISSVVSKFKAPFPVKKRFVSGFNDSEFFYSFPVPMIEVIHDRAAVEVLRGCIRGCRFCQAGFIYRPFRTKTPLTLNAQAFEQCEASGYDEVSLLSLSTGDYPRLGELFGRLLEWTEEKRVNISLPSLRIDNFNDPLVEKMASLRKSGLTFAPEAGTQRMRDVINKNITEEEILDGCRLAFRNGYTSVKLYFMIGLPGETDEDVVGIVDLAGKIVDEFYSLKERPRGKSVSVNVSVSCFVPKPFTPFQFVPQDSADEFSRKQKLLTASVKSRKITVHYHDSDTSFIEAVLARGGRRLSKVILSAYLSGSFFDSWGEGFRLENWKAAFKKHRIDPRFYANREHSEDETEPWEILDYGVSKDFLKREYKKSKLAAVTGDCGHQCSSCGISDLSGEACFAGIQALFQQN